jgi:putative endonuclease
MKGYVYILRSVKTNLFYIGSTTNVKERLNRHNKGEVLATRNFKPWNLEFFQEYETIGKARKIELKLKNLKRKDYIEKIIKDRCIKMGR